MSIDDAKPEDWDAIKADRFYDNRSFDIKDATCALPADHREMMRRDSGQRESDNVNRPKHYTTSEIECIDYIQMQLGSGVRDYLRGQIYKYMHRHQLKGAEVEDLKKARWYIDKLIYELEQGG